MVTTCASTGAAHPGRAEVLASMNCDGDAVMQALLREQAQQHSVRLFCKHMAHHLVEIDLDFLDRTSNVFLIRDPREMLPSLSIQLPEARLADTSLKQQWQLYSGLCDAGQIPMILDSRELLLDPEGVLMQLCRHLHFDFDTRNVALGAWPHRRGRHLGATLVRGSAPQHGFRTVR